MERLYTYKFRLYPTKSQEVYINKHFGCCRYVYNYFLDKSNKSYKDTKKIPNYYDNCAELTKLKNTEEYNWLKEVNSQSLQKSIKNLSIAYKRFFSGISEKPDFHTKNSAQCYNLSKESVKVIGNRITVAKFKEGIKFDNHRKIDGDIKCCSISKNPAGEYYISLSVKKDMEKLPLSEKFLGIDLGIKDFITISDGNKISPPKFKKSKLSKLKYLQRKHSKKQLKSNNREKVRKKYAKLYNHLSNQKKDFFHKLSLKLVSENQVLMIEDLDVKGMMEKNNKKHKSNLAGMIQECSWSDFIKMLKYKAEFYGHNVFEIDRWYPSSKTCYSCGYVNKKLTLKDREWDCHICGEHHDRDINAAKNILREGINELIQIIAVGTTVKSLWSCSHLGGMLKQEAFTL